MLDRFLRATVTKIHGPIARLLLRLGVSPDIVTVVGTVGVSVGALYFFPRGELWIGVLVITAFVVSDTIEGIMARREAVPAQRSMLKTTGPAPLGGRAG